MFDSETGKYTAQLTLPTSGDWEVEVSARVSRFEQPIALVPCPHQLTFGLVAWALRFSGSDSDPDRFGDGTVESSWPPP